jgi:hypothetical protein
MYFIMNEAFLLPVGHFLPLLSACMISDQSNFSVGHKSANNEQRFGRAAVHRWIWMGYSIPWRV